MKRGLLVGEMPPVDLGYCFPENGPYDGVVIGSLTMGELLCFSKEAVFSALAEGKEVLLYVPGLPKTGQNRALAAACASARRMLKAWGVVFTEGCYKRLITAAEARALLAAGKKPQPGAVLTPLAKEIMEGKS